MPILVPAKINLHLRVGPPRTDGFHPLLTWMTTIGLFDTLTIGADVGSHRPQNDLTGDIVLTCSDMSLPCDDRNIVVKAAKLLRQDARLGANIHLEKQIPHGGGLGGGSSDAASTLIALNRFWNLGKTPGHLHELAARLGSDVPFFLHGPSSVCRGRGEAVRPIPSPARARWVLLILPNLSMPTPAVYRQFDAMKLGNPRDVEIEPDWNQWAALSSQDLLANLVNDLEPPAFAIEPALAHLRTELEQCLARPVRMSGSGSSLFTLYDEPDQASQGTRAVGQMNVRATAVELAPEIPD